MRVFNLTELCQKVIWNVFKKFMKRDQCYGDMPKLLPVRLTLYMGICSCSLLLHLGKHWKMARSLGSCTLRRDTREALSSWFQRGPVLPTAAISEWTGGYKISVSPFLSHHNSAFPINNLLKKLTWYFKWVYEKHTCE